MPDSQSQLLSSLQAQFQTLDPQLPMALFPLRLQLRFATPRMVAGLGRRDDMQEDLSGAPPSELWVRIYPDEIFLHTHEAKLNEEEYEAAQDYWAALWQSVQSGEGSEARRRLQQGAWQLLAEEYGPVRARWIVRQTAPSLLDSDGFPTAAPQLPNLELTADAWNEAPRTYLLPDRFVARLEQNGTVREHAGQLIQKTDEALILGIDPDKDDTFGDTARGLNLPEEMSWLTDFPKAVEIGMGMRIPLSETERTGFDRMYVFGWFSELSPAASVQRLQGLFDNHRYKPGGMDFVAPGTPTNNTREYAADRGPDDRTAEESYDLAEIADGDDPLRLARALGLPSDTFSGLDHSQFSTVAAGLHIHSLLFEASLGQALQVWQSSLSAQDRAQLLDYMKHWVSGRGLLPSLRIDNQPYAFLPALPFSLLKSQPELLQDPFLRGLWRNILSPLDDWFAQQVDSLPHLSRDLTAAQVQPTFLKLLELHPTSVAYRQRFALSPGFFDLEAEKLPDAIKPFAEKQRNAARLAEVQAELNALGFPVPQALDQLYFDQGVQPIAERDESDGPQDEEASDLDVLLGIEGDAIPPLGNTDQNYLQWLSTASVTDIRQENLPGGERPYAVLYQLLRHRLLQSGGDAAVREGINWAASLPVAELRRLLQEHLDCCTYRLDAWMGGLAGKRLAELRASRAEGIHIGAWGYLENVRPKDGLPQRGEYIPAPSLRHATTAAILRSGFQANQSSSAGAFAVNLSSTRVKEALYLMEGVRQGQDLAALLGYHLERGMREYRNAQGIPILTSLIYDLRQRYTFKVAPLVQPGQSAPTELEEDTAQHVINALDLLKDRANWAASLPSPPTAAQLAAMQPLLDKLDEDLDSVKDVLVAEGVYQLVDGQVDRAKAALDALTEGDQLIRPEIAEIPRSSLPLSFRMGVLLPDRPLPTTGGAPLSPRALVGAKLNRWLLDKLPDLSLVRVRVRWAVGEGPSGEPDYEHVDLPLRNLFIEPIDLAYMMHLQRENPDASELRYRIERLVRQQHNLPLTQRIEILERDRTGFGQRDFTLFELEPLAAGLGKLLLETRAIGPADFLQANEAAVGETGQFWAPGFQLRQLRNVALQMEGNQDSLASRIATAKGRLASGAEISEEEMERDMHRLREAMFFYAGLGWVHAVPAPVDALNRLVLEQECRRAQQLLEEAAGKLAEARELLSPGSPSKLSELLASPVSGDAQQDLDRLEKLVGLLFGRFYKVHPDFRLPNTEAIGQALQSPELQALKPDFALERWLQSLAPVRPHIDLYQRGALLSDLFGRSRDVRGLDVVQLPIRDGQTGPWVGQAYGDFVPHGDTLSLALELQSDFDLGHATFSGLLIDEWQELVPDPTANAGIALQYDQPDSEAPNAVLLALTPAAGMAWDWEHLVQAVADTMLLAKKRAVDPDLLKASFWDQLLPGLLGPIPTGEETGDGLNFGSLPGQRRIIPREELDLTDLGLGDVDLGNVED